MAHALENLGNAWADAGDATKAISFYDRYLVVARELGNRCGEGRALGNLGNAWADLGNVRKAITFYDQQLAIAREIEDRHGEAFARWNKAWAIVELGEFSAAVPLLELSLAFYESIGDPRAILIQQNLTQLQKVSPLGNHPANQISIETNIFPEHPPSDSAEEIIQNSANRTEEITDEEIYSWFKNNINNPLSEWLVKLQVFWCIGMLDRDALESTDLALGYKQLASKLKNSNPQFAHIPLPRSIGYIRENCLADLESYFNCLPFSDSAWSGEEQQSALRIEGWVGSRAHGRWTPRARKAWIYVNRFLKLQGLRPTITNI
ncbi:Tetratricopeptide repeat protein [Gemmata sp. SH-PL17]|uniref:tetratricopeptide repeat protein n=1 Tax=Gemmata sp. SH-PL17 TaxID=1630693 RepID=UPI00078C7220|nr:tetratricopeptide repeat protein [Gemmata sp. SH-PL17]AMV24080.1 Tetratricopeptide repeat protein [Gemmata sp. SH-PL17]